MRRGKDVLAWLVIMIGLACLVTAQPAQEWVQGVWGKIQTEDQHGHIIYAIRTAQYGTLEAVLDASWGSADQYWASIKPGSQLSLRGRVEGKIIYVTDPNLYVLQRDEVEELLLPQTLGMQRVLLILVRYSDTPFNPYPPAQLETVWRDDVNPAIVHFSNDQFLFWLADNPAAWMTPWLTIPLANGLCTTSHLFELADLADAAAAGAGYAVPSFERVAYAFPSNATCAFNGLSTIGGAPSRSWFNGLQALAPHVILHEMGHALGLFHSHSCRTLGPVVLTDPCTIDDLGDFLDTMGRPPVDPLTFQRVHPPYNASQLERLGWLGAQGPPILEVVSSGVYRLVPYASDGEYCRALKIRRTDQDGPQFYYLVARRAVGEDEFLEGFPGITNGVTLHISDMNDGQSSYLLDAHPQTATWDDAALTLGETYTEPKAHFSVHVLTAGPEGSELALSLPTDDISIALLLPFVPRWHEGETLRIDVEVLVGTQPAAGALWEWGVDVPRWGFFLQAPEILGPTGEWHFSYPLTPGGLPLGAYTVYARVSWEDKITPVVSGGFAIAP